jgi:hypothetical protein
MLSIVCYVLAAILFFLAGANQTIFSQHEIDEIAWGLFLLVVGQLLAGVGPLAPWRRTE